MIYLQFATEGEKSKGEAPIECCELLIAVMARVLRLWAVVLCGAAYGELSGLKMSFWPKDATASGVLASVEYNSQHGGFATSICDG